MAQLDEIPATADMPDGPVPSPVRRSGRLGALLRDLLEAAVLAVVLFVLLQQLVQNTIVDGSSMAPNFVDQQRLIVNRLAYRWSEPGRGDVIVFHSPEEKGKDFIKRLIALPGETVTIRRGVVSVDGEPLAEPWAPIRGDDDFGPFTVPAGGYFVLGDNRPDSNDSRTWGTTGRGGALGRGQIVGRVWLSVWPVDTLGLVRADGPGRASRHAKR